MSEKIWYYKNFGQEEVGPLSSTELYEKVQSGVVQPRAWIRRDGFATRRVRDFWFHDGEVIPIPKVETGRYLWIPVVLLLAGLFWVVFGLSLIEQSEEPLLIVLFWGLSFLCFIAMGVVKVLRSIEYSVRSIREMMENQVKSEKKDS